MGTIELSVSTGELFDVRHCVLVEAISRPFTIELMVRSSDPSVDLEAIIGGDATVRLDSGHPDSPLGGVRELSGRVESMSLLAAEPTGLSSYRLGVVPQLSMLGLRRNQRLFLNLTAFQSVQRLLTEWTIPFEWQIDVAAYPGLDLRLQYGETDLAFVSRVLEEAGIAYVFRQLADGTTLVLSDRLETAAERLSPIPFIDNPNPKESREYVTALRVAHAARPHAVALGDYDFTRPDRRLLAAHPLAFDPARDADPRREHHLHDPHQALAAVSGEGRAAKYRHREDSLASRADRALSALRSDSYEIGFQLATVDIEPGMVFRISGHPELDERARLLCTAVEIDAVAAGVWSTRVRAVSAAQPFRPPRRTPRPNAAGFMTATVIGPPHEEIQVDDHGRVRVHFPWDREGGGNDSSPSLRVVTGWAGRGFGTQYLPRIGQEVLVAFLGGNPDAPVVVGRAYNRAEPVPYPLPGSADISGQRSATSPGAGWNEASFRDTAGDELVDLQAERNRRALVKHDAELTVGGDRSVRVATQQLEVTLRDRVQETRGNREEVNNNRRTEESQGNDHRRVALDQVERIEVDRVATTLGSRHEHVVGSRLERIGFDHHQRYKSRVEGFGGLSRSVAGSIGISTGDYLVGSGDTHVMASTDAVFDAPDITLKGAGGFVRIGPAGVVIVGTIVRINQGGAAGDGPGVGVQRPDPPREAPAEPPVPPSPMPEIPRPVPGKGFVPTPPKPPPPPVPVVTVAIFGPALGSPGCSYIPLGKTHAFTAVGSPAGGHFRWSLTGGASFEGASDTDKVVVRGTAVSAELDEVELEVEYTARGGTASAVRKLTVFEIQKIEARLAETPCLRAGAAHPPQPPRVSVADKKLTDASMLSVLRGSGALELTASVTPEKVPLDWLVERAGDDAVAGPVPSGLAGGHERTGRLQLDATGSFHVHAFVDCDGDRAHEADDAGKVLNLNIVEATVLPGAPNNMQLLYEAPGMFHRVPNESWLNVSSSRDGSLQTFGHRPQNARLGVRLRGGGSDGLRGTKQIDLGFLQVCVGDTTRGTYAGGATARCTITDDPTTDYVIKDGASGELSFPIRDHKDDKDLPNAGGSGVFVNTSRKLEGPNDPDGGKQWTIEMVDGPALGLPLAHPITEEPLQSISGANHFQIYATLYSTHFEQSYGVLAKANWYITFGTYTAKDGWSNENARSRGDRKLLVFEPLVPAKEAPGFERCPPGYTERLRVDARDTGKR